MCLLAAPGAALWGEGGLSFITLCATGSSQGTGHGTASGCFSLESSSLGDDGLALWAQIQIITIE